jgi:hypothetical protein
MSRHFSHPIKQFHFSTLFIGKARIPPLGQTMPGIGKSLQQQMDELKAQFSYSTDSQCEQKFWCSIICLT